MRKKILFPLLLLCLFINIASFAEQATDEVPDTAPLRADDKELQTIIDSFSKYAATIKPELREEIIEYRKAVARINQQKQLLYKRLSQEAQRYLAKEQEYKKSLSSVKQKYADS